MRKWTETDDAKMLQMKAEGCSFSVIADAIGRSRSSIAGRLSRLNGYVRKPPPENPIANAVHVAKIATGEIRNPRKSPTKLATMIDKIARGNMRTHAGFLAMEEVLRRARNRVGKPDANGVRLIDIGSHQCRYPLDNGYGLDLRMCGKVVVDPIATRGMRGSYCKDCLSVVTRPM